MCSCITHANWCAGCCLSDLSWLLVCVPLGVPLPLLLYLRGWDYKEGNRVSYNMILISALSLLAYFAYIFIDIIIYALASTPWSYIILWMVGWVIADPPWALQVYEWWYPGYQSLSAAPECLASEYMLDDLDLPCPWWICRVLNFRN
jgi:hypothetical protein